MSDVNEASDPVEPFDPDDLPIDAAGGAKKVRKIVIRVVMMIVILGISTWVLVKAFGDLDLDAILDAVKSLEDAELMALIGITAIMVWAEGLLTASVVPGMPARRGVLAWLGPNAVASVVPGPADMPVRYRMFVSWGYTSAEAGSAVASSGILNIINKIVLPVLAVIALTLSGISIDGVLGPIVTAIAIVGVIGLLVAFVIGSERRTAVVGRVVDRVWATTLRMLQREKSGGSALARKLVAQRATAIGLMRGRGLRALGSISLVSVIRASLFVMCIRFVGVPQSAVSWLTLVCVWAIVLGLTVIPLMPGNAGLSELAYVGLLTPIAGEQYVNEITAGVLIFRILTWLLLVPVGAIAIGIWRWSLKRDTSAQPA